MEFLNKFDKQQVQKITLIVIAALTILALVLLLVIVVASVNPTNSFGFSGGFSNMEDLQISDNDLKTGTLVLADDEHSYNYTFSDDELYGCGAYRKDHIEKDDSGKMINAYYMNSQSAMKLTQEAMAALHNMLVDAESNVKKDMLCIDSCYGYMDESTKEEYKTAQLVYLAGIVSSNEPNVDLPKEYREWLDANAAKYGFIESFEDGYRYVGVAHAKAISGSNDINSLAEYIAYLKENTSANASKTIETSVDGATYKIYYATPVDGKIQIPSESEGEVTISGTNEGGVIVTVKVK